MLTITISTGNPLDRQLKELTGDGWSSCDWDRVVEWEPENDVIRHRKTELMISILVDHTPAEPVQEQEPDIYEKFEQFAADLRANDRQWREINPESYGEMLDCLPPLAMSSLGFLSSEPYTHLSTGEGVYISCIKSGSKFFAAYLTRKEFKTATPAGIPKYETA
jgi:hypothetical protein